MKLSFSTRGWDNIPWDELVNLAVDMDFQGIEVYNPQAFDAFVGKGGPLHTYNTRATVRDLREKKLCIPVIDTPLDISTPGNHVPELKALIDLASDASAPYICIKAQEDEEGKVKETHLRD